jgi:hypothetical protein
MLPSLLSGKCDLGWEFPGPIARTDWLQIKDKLKQHRPALRVLEYVNNVETHVSMGPIARRSATCACGRRCRSPSTGKG